jgi:hypothetical protein
MPRGDLTKAAVQAAIREFDQIGRAAFLEKHGFRPAKSYFLIDRGRRYDSKAIAGVAYKYIASSKGPLRAKDFSGGELTVARTLRALGFDVLREPRRSEPAQSPSTPELSLPLIKRQPARTRTRCLTSTSISDNAH